ncbi:MAG: DUF4340 domain-containing protein [Chloroflexi bacterium]|nr:DUF4340 domain-containing protein [Chloroflexota bacterium]
MNIRTTLVLVVLLSLVAGYFYFYELRRTTPAEPQPPWFYSLSREDITRIHVRDGGYEQGFVLKADNWVFEDQPTLPVGLDRFSGVSLLVSGPRSRRLLAEQASDPVMYGLDNPSITIQINATGDRAFQVELGSQTPDGLSYYGQLAGQPQVFLVDALWGDVLGRLAVDPPYPSWYYRLDPTDVVRVDFTAQAKTLSLVRRDDGWTVQGTEDTPVDPQRWQEVTPLLGGPSSIQILQDQLPEPAAYGLENPQATVHVEWRKSESFYSSEETLITRALDLVVGNQLPDGSGYYARPAQQDYLLAIDSGWYQKMAQLVQDPPKLTKGG